MVMGADNLGNPEKGHRVMFLRGDGTASIQKAKGKQNGEWRCNREPALVEWEPLGLVGFWICPGFPNVTISWDYADDFTADLDDELVRVCAPLPLPHSLQSWYNTYEMDPPQI